MSRASATLAGAIAEPERDAIAVGLAASLRDPVGDLAPDVVRRWWRLVATESFDAWLIDWPAGTEVPRHDHDGAAASICVVRGQLVETRFATGGSSSTSSTRAGQVFRVPSDVSHLIGNRSADPATSVHVYSPPLRSMGFYDPSGLAVRHDTIDPTPALWRTELP